MIELRIHGRGGQGGVTLAKIIATTRFLQGDSVQAFGIYAAERSGAPLQAFCRYSREPIVNRNLVYKPHHVIVLDPTLVGPGILSGLKAEGWILINAPGSPAPFSERFPGYRIAVVDATAIARENGLGTRSVPIVNTALAGAVARVLGFELKWVQSALEHLGFVGGNLTASSRGYDEVTVLDTPLDSEATVEAVKPSTARVPGFLTRPSGELPAIKTGQWATEQPRRQQMVPPCNHVCPAGNDVQGFLQALAREEQDEALAILLRTNPFPSVCGRVCPAPCVESCNRMGLDGAVHVRELERLAGDRGQVNIEPMTERFESVAVVGSGPAGLSAAYHLRRLGYRVKVFEASDHVGGLLRSGIPGYRLPLEVIDREIGRIVELGVEIVTGSPVDRNRLLELTRSYDALAVATGLQELRSLRLGLEETTKVVQGIDFLDRSRRGEVRVDGEEIIVVGGGNTAMDAARSALRLGALSVRIVYRRTRKEMPAIPEEIEQGLEEGIAIDFLTQPISLEELEDGRCRLVCRRMVLGEADESGRRRPVDVPGSDFSMECHRLILALGQSPDLSVFPEGTEVRQDGRLIGLLETPVFAVGDLATKDGTVAAAIGSGRRCALHIHKMLFGNSLSDEDRPEDWVDIWRDVVIEPDSLKMHLFERRPPMEVGTLLPEARRSTFDEVHLGLSDLDEAKRCLSCGVCNECDLCVTYCPEGVLKRVGHRFEFDYAYCKGCGVCAAECPRNVIFMSHL